MRRRTPLLAVAAVFTAALSAPVVSAARESPASVSPIRHVVVLFMENHSFDSVLGFWCDAHPRRCPAGGMPASVTLADRTVVTPTRDPDIVPSVLHTVEDQVAAIDGGKMDGWANMPSGQCDAATKYQCISGYRPWQIPNLTALARHFAISDHTFSVADSPSWAGHLAIAAASTDNFYGDNPHPVPGVKGGGGWGCNSDRVTPWRAPDGRLKTVPSCVPDPALGIRYGGAFRSTPVSSVPTIFERLDAAGLSWKIYGSPSGSKGYGFWDVCPSFASCLDTSEVRHLVPDDRFMKDAAAGALPTFSLLTPGGNHFLDGCHNAMSMTACDNWVGRLVTALEKSPDWSSTAVFLTFDDFGGFYDQVPPPPEPDGTQEGPRVPMIILGPYAISGYTDSTATTFAGVLAYTEHTFGLAPLGVNDASAYDFSNAFNYRQPPAKPVQMVTRPLPAAARRIRVTPALADDPS